MSITAVALACRTSDRTAAAARGAVELCAMAAERLGLEPRVIGEAGDGQGGWEEDLRASRGCLLEAGGQVDDALSGANRPLLFAGDCSIALTTLPVALAHRPDARVLWLDAHGDFNTPSTSASGYLGGMALAGACGRFAHGLDRGAVPEGQVVMAGIRDLDDEERAALERSPVTVIGASPVETLVAVKNALDGGPVYIHLDLDVIDPTEMPAAFPVPGGLEAEKLYDLFEAVGSSSEVIGLEVTSFQAPDDDLERTAAASTALHAIDPLLDALAEGDGARG